MDQNIIVTVGIPIYNAERFLELSIRSVLNQTFRNFELILSDDGSTDASLEISKSFTDPRIIVISDGKNRGISYRLNEQISIARGEYFVRMDADDIMFPERLKKIVETFNRNEDCNIIGSSAVIINENDQVIGFRKSPKHTSLIECYFSTRFIHPSVAYRKSLVVNNLYNSKYDGCEDHELWFRIFSCSKALILEEALIFYREPTNLKLGRYCKRSFKLLNFFKENKLKLGLWNFIKATTLVYLKIAIYVFVTPLNLDKILLHLRNKSLLEKEVGRYQDILNKIVKGVY